MNVLGVKRIAGVLLIVAALALALWWGVSALTGDDADTKQVWEEKATAQQADTATTEVCSMLSDPEGNRESLLTFSLGYSNYEGKPGAVAKALGGWATGGPVTPAQKACE